MNLYCYTWLTLNVMNPCSDLCARNPIQSLSAMMQVLSGSRALAANRMHGLLSAAQKPLTISDEKVMEQILRSKLMDESGRCFMKLKYL